MTKYYSIQALCKLTSVSVRTLHYYDEIKLLKPTHRAPNGHRVYSENELLRLQQIVTLKFLGLSLDQIGTLLQENKLNLLDSLKMQLSALREECSRIEKISKLLHYLIKQQESCTAIDWALITNITKVIHLKKSDTHEWYKKYFTPKELPHFEMFAKKRSDDWMYLFELTRNNLHTDPKSEFGQALANKWMNLIEEIYGQLPEIKNKLWHAYKAGMIPHDYFPYDVNVITYLENADERFKK
jgi:DNA-binding transcriptional MerR regulator